MIVGLDYPRLLSQGRLVRRTAKGIATKQERCNGNTESLRNAISRDSIVRWHFSSWRRKRDTMRASSEAGRAIYRQSPMSRQPKVVRDDPASDVIRSVTYGCDNA